MIRHKKHLSRLNSALDIDNFQTRLIPLNVARLLLPGLGLALPLALPE